MKCNIFTHKFMDGFGAMGDCLICIKCGLGKYPEALAPLTFIIANIKGIYKYMPGAVYYSEYPYIRFHDNFGNTTAYFDEKGKFIPIYGKLNES